MMAVAYAYDFFADLTPAQACQLLYVLSAAAVLAVAATPDTTQRLLTQYGARDSDSTLVSASSRVRGWQPDTIGTGPLFRLISCLTSIGKIPHAWFIHFYVLSLSCSVFWAVQFLANGTLLELIVKKQLSRQAPAMNINQVILVWFLMGLQGARRLYEYLVILRPSSSKMWIIHWLLGNVFYLCTSISIWVEGSKSIQQCSHGNCPDIGLPPTKSTVASSLIFMIAWLMQYRCHRYLAGLTKYSLPKDGLFRYLVCPHYTCECLLYTSLAVIAAPEGQSYNRTLACGVLFVSVNLGVTANRTKLWYADKFGSQVQGRWKMIPIIF